MAIETATEADTAEEGHDDSVHQAEFWMLGFGAGVIAGTLVGIAIGEMVLGVAFGFVLGSVVGTLLAVR
jgi:uncharacterized transporter YbjL